jgi:hypothetical protein
MTVDVWVPKKFVANILEHAQHDQKDHGKWAKGRRAPREPRTQEEKSLKKFLSEMVQIRGNAPKGITYNSIEDLILQEGEFFEPPKSGDELPEGCKRGPAKECFSNAFQNRYKAEDLIYTEGYATSDVLEGFGFLHAWLTTPDGKVIDPTWKPGQGTAYFGVRLNNDFVTERTLATETYGILANDWLNDSDLLKNGFPKDAIWKEKRTQEHHGDLHDEKHHGNWARGIKHEPGEIEKKARSVVGKDKLSKSEWKAAEKKAKAKKKKVRPKRKKPQVSPTGREYSEREQLMMSDPMRQKKGVRAQRGINREAYIAEMANGEAVYVKQITDSIKSGEGIPQGELQEALAEVTAYELSEQLGYDIVPPTVLRDAKSATVASDWVENARTVSSIGPGEKPELSGQIIEDYENMMVMDVIIGNIDRHMDQILIYDSGGSPRLAAIDAGLSLSPWDAEFDSFEIDMSMNDYFMSQTDNRYQLFGREDFPFDTSETGPWQQALDQRVTIRDIIQQSFSRSTIPSGQVEMILQGVDSRFDFIEEQLENVKSGGDFVPEMPRF